MGHPDLCEKVLVPVAEGARVQVHRHVLRLAGIEADLLKALELAVGAIRRC